MASGSGLAPSLAKYPRHFDDLFCSLVGSGEDSGTLEVMLDRVATYKEKTEQLKAKIKKAMTYPIAVICVAINRVRHPVDQSGAGFRRNVPEFRF